MRSRLLFILLAVLALAGAAAGRAINGTQRRSLGTSGIRAALARIRAAAQAVQKAQETWPADPTDWGGGLLRYANHWDSVARGFRTRNSVAGENSLVAERDFPAIVGDSELSEFGSRRRTAFRLTLTLLVAAGRAAAAGVPVSLTAYFEPGDDRERADVYYIDDDGNERRFRFAPSTRAKEYLDEYRPATQVLRLETDATGSVVIHVPVQRESISSIPIVAWPSEDGETRPGGGGPSPRRIFIFSPDERMMREKLVDPAALSQSSDSRRAPVSRAEANRVAQQVRPIADMARITLVSPFLRALEAARVHRGTGGRLARRDLDAEDGFGDNEFARVLTLASLLVRDEREEQHRRLAKRWGPVGDAIEGGVDCVSDPKDCAEDIGNAIAKPIVDGIRLGKDAVSYVTNGVTNAVVRGAEDLGSSLSSAVMSGVKTAYYVTADGIRSAARDAKDAAQVSVQEVGQGIAKGVAVVVKIGDQLYAAACRSMRQVARAVEGVVLQVVKAIETVIEFLKMLLSGILQAIFGNARVIQGYLDILPSFTRRTMQLLGGAVGDVLENLGDTAGFSVEAGSRQFATLVRESGFNPSLSSVPGVRGLNSAASYVLHVVLKVLAKVFEVMQGAMLSAVDSALRRLDRLASKATAFLQNVPCVKTLSDAGINVMERILTMKLDLASIIETMGTVLAAVSRGFFDCAAELVDFFVDNFLAPLVDIMGSLFNGELRIPWISDIFRTITGLRLNFAAALSIVGAILTSFSSLVATGGIKALPRMTVNGTAMADAVVGALIPGTGRALVRRSRDDALIAAGTTLGALLLVFSGVLGTIFSYLSPVVEYVGDQTEKADAYVAKKGLLMAAWKVAKVVSMMPLPALIFIANKLGGNANYGVTPKLGHPLMSISIAQTSWKVFGIVMPAILGQLGAGNLKKPMEAVSAVGHLVLDSVGLPYLIDAPPDVLGPENKKWSKVQVTGNFIAQPVGLCRGFGDACKSPYKEFFVAVGIGGEVMKISVNSWILSQVVDD